MKLGITIFMVALGLVGLLGCSSEPAPEVGKSNEAGAAAANTPLTAEEQARLDARQGASSNREMGLKGKL